MIETLRGTQQRFRVQDSRIVDAQVASIGLEENDDRLVLVTCYPFDAIVPGGPLRYMVTALRVDESGDADTLYFAAAEPDSPSLQR